jgi:hypothetical protein
MRFARSSHVLLKIPLEVVDFPGGAVIQFASLKGKHPLLVDRRDHS